MGEKKMDLRARALKQNPIRWIAGLLSLASIIVPGN
jgi:hypothetical protein